MGKRLDAVATRVKFEELAAAMRAAWEASLNAPPTDRALCVLLTQASMESAQWKGTVCFNFSRTKATPSWTRDHCFQPTEESVPRASAEQMLLSKAPRGDGVAGHNIVVELHPSKFARVRLYPDHPAARFKAYESLEAGASAYFAELHDRLRPVWDEIAAGDPRAFVRALDARNYSTSGAERYLPPFMWVFERYAGRLSDAAGGGLRVIEGGQADAPVDSNPTPTSPSVAPVAPTADLVPSPAPARPRIELLASDESVEFAQRRLIACGYDLPGLVADGIFNSVTKQAVELFQLQHVDEHGRPLRADGIVGNKTWWALMNPSGDAQRSHVPQPSTAGLTTTRTELIELLLSEYRKPVVEDPTRPNRSPDIDRYWEDPSQCGLPWCCAFVSWALYTVLGRHVLEKHHVAVQAMWQTARRLELDTKRSKPGDVFIQLKPGGRGHTGFVVGISADGKTTFTCEGNSGNRLKLGQRPTASIDGFIDCLQDGQSLDFPRRTDLKFHDTSSDSTR